MTPADARRAQERLGVRADGVFGPVSWTALLTRLANRDLGQRGLDLARAMATHLPEYGIDTPLRIAHFLAQCLHESGAFRYLREIWGPTPAQKRYEGRADLGNAQPGDGYKFMGRGLVQITGRDNYARYGNRLGVDLVNAPHLAEDAFVAVRIACLYWQDHRLNLYADADNALAVSNGINRGNPASIREPNGFADRKAYLARAKQVLL